MIKHLQALDSILGALWVCFPSPEWSGKQRKEGRKGSRTGLWEGRKGKWAVGSQPPESTSVISQYQSVCQHLSGGQFPETSFLPPFPGFHYLPESPLVKCFCLLICLFTRSQLCYKGMVVSEDTLIDIPLRVFLSLVGQFFSMWIFLNLPVYDFWWGFVVVVAAVVLFCFVTRVHWNKLKKTNKKGLENTIISDHER